MATVPVGYVKTKTLSEKYKLPAYKVRELLAKVRCVSYKRAFYFDQVSAEIVLSGHPAEYTLSLVRLAELLGVSRHLLQSRGIVPRLMSMKLGIFLGTQYRFGLGAVEATREMLGETPQDIPDPEPRKFDCKRYYQCLDDTAHRNARGMACETCKKYVPNENYLTSHL